MIESDAKPQPAAPGTRRGPMGGGNLRLCILLEHG